MSEHRRPVKVTENHKSPYAQDIEVGPHTLQADEPIALGGQGLGPDPYELLLASLGACTTMTIRMYANQKGGFPAFTQSVVLTHRKEVGEDGLKVDVFERTLTLSGDLTEEQRTKLLEIADRCPVSRTLEKNARMITRLA